MRTASSSSASAAAAAARKAPAEKTVIAAPVALAERAERYQEEKKAKRSKIDEKDQKPVPPKDQAEEKQKKNKKDKSAKKDKKKERQERQKRQEGQEGKEEGKDQTGNNKSDDRSKESEDEDHALGVRVVSCFACGAVPRLAAKFCDECGSRIPQAETDDSAASSCQDVVILGFRRGKADVLKCRDDDWDGLRAAVSCAMAEASLVKVSWRSWWPKMQKAVSMICNDPGAKPCTVETRYNLKSESQIQQHASQLNGQVATAMSRDAHGHTDIMGCTGVSRHVQGWTKVAGVEYIGMSGLTTVSLLGRTNTSCTCVSVHPSHCPL